MKSLAKEIPITSDCQELGNSTLILFLPVLQWTSSTCQRQPKVTGLGWLLSKQKWPFILVIFWRNNQGHSRAATCDDNFYDSKSHKNDSGPVGFSWKYTAEAVLLILIWKSRWQMTGSLAQMCSSPFIMSGTDKGWDWDSSEDILSGEKKQHLTDLQKSL